MATDKPQIIFQDGRPAFAVIPFAEYRALAPDAAQAYLSDEELYRQARAEDDGEHIPAAVVYRMLDGDSPIAAYRDWRGLSQRELANAAGVTPGYISQIERGARAPSRKLLARLATALRLAPDDLI